MADKEDMIAIHFICKFDKDKTISYINLFNLTRRQPIRLSFEVIVFKGTDSPSILPMRSRFSDFSQSGISTSSMSGRSSTSLLGSSRSSWRIRAFRLSRSLVGSCNCCFRDDSTLKTSLNETIQRQLNHRQADTVDVSKNPTNHRR